MRSNTFASKFRGRDIFSYKVPRSGISYHPWLEWRLAAKEYHYTWEEFMALDGVDQSWVVASYRVEKQMEAVVSKAQSDEMKRKGPKK